MQEPVTSVPESNMYYVLLRGEPTSHRILARGFEINQGTGTYEFFDTHREKAASFPIDCVKAVLRETELQILALPADSLAPLFAMLHRERESSMGRSAELNDLLMQLEAAVVATGAR